MDQRIRDADSSDESPDLVRRRLLPWLVLAPWLANPVGATPTGTLVHPPAESANDQRCAYRVQLLQLALRKAGSKLALRAYRAPMQQGRVLRNIEQADSIDVYWSMTSKAREARLLPIRIPIDRGLLGWRLLLIRQQDAERFAGIKALDELRLFKAGLGHDWPDREILAAAGIEAVPFTTYDSLFQQLARGRVDYLSRSVSEIVAERDANPELQLMIEPSLALHYPAAEYFFVNQGRKDLANLIEKGLRRALADGSFDSLFQKYHARDLRDARLAQRRVLEINNPLLPAATPLSDQRLWFKP